MTGASLNLALLGLWIVLACVQSIGFTILVLYAPTALRKKQVFQLSIYIALGIYAFFLLVGSLQKMAWLFRKVIKDVSSSYM